eukprot:COSAG06_NODE_9155_length_1972_cov_1.072611_3_plen_85_part_00
MAARRLESVRAALHQPEAAPAPQVAAVAAADGEAVDCEFFRQHGYVSLGKILSDSDLAACRECFDRNRRDYHQFWASNAIWQSW